MIAALNTSSPTLTTTTTNSANNTGTASEADGSSYEDIAAAGNEQAAIALAKASTKAHAAANAPDAHAKKAKGDAANDGHDLAARLGHAVAGTVDAVSAVAAASHMDLIGTVTSAVHAASNLASALSGAADPSKQQQSQRETGIGALLSSSLPPPSERLTSATLAASLGTSANADAQALSKANAGAHSILAALQSHLEKAAPVAAKSDASSQQQQQQQHRDDNASNARAHDESRSQRDASEHAARAGDPREARDARDAGAGSGGAHLSDSRGAFGVSDGGVLSSSTIDGPALAQDPRASAAASAAEAILMDPALRAAVMPHSAQISVTTEAGVLTVALHAKNGVTDVSMTGAQAPLLEAHKHELVKALASEGMSLGNFDTKSDGHGSADREAQEQQDDLRAGGLASSASSSSNPVKNAIARMQRGIRGIVA